MIFKKKNILKEKWKAFMKTSKNLNEEIQADLKAIKLKKKRLQQLKATEASNKPLRDYKVGKIYLNAVKTLTAWCTKVNERADKLLESPEEVRAEVLLEKSQTLLNQAQKIDNRENEQATKLALNSAELVMTIENLMYQYPKLSLLDNLKQMSIDLDNEVQRLRPIQDQNKRQAINQFIQAIVSSSIVSEN
jgi:hypothetical protein